MQTPGAENDFFALVCYFVEFHSTFPTLGRVSKLSLLSLIGNVVLF